MLNIRSKRYTFIFDELQDLFDQTIQTCPLFIICSSFCHILLQEQQDSLLVQLC